MTMTETDTVTLTVAELNALTWTAFERGRGEDADRLDWVAGALAAHRGVALWKDTDAFVAGWEQGKREVAAAEAGWAEKPAHVNHLVADLVAELAAHTALVKGDWAVAA
jgi:hypothetical protein